MVLLFCISEWQAADEDEEDNHLWEDDWDDDNVDDDFSKQLRFALLFCYLVQPSSNPIA